MWATYKGRSTTVKMLITRGADVNAHGNFHISSLLWAAGRGYSEIVKDLIAHGAKVNVGDKVNYYPTFGKGFTICFYLYTTF